MQMNRFSTARVFRAMALLAFAQIFQSQGALARPDEWLAPLTPRSASMVIDARTGESLFASNPDLRLPPASLVKMMTLYLAFRAVETGEISLDSLVTISDAAANQSPPRLGLAAGQQIALRYLIRATAVQSANDAAVALAEALAGTEPAFVTMMNARAAAFGMENTSFANATGLSREG
ncbi:MAG TPA: D-alanyl-D-alanine carboxypeptidase, partial [Aliiroseovarius sp.]|nr:D-alanyl-D-alanine carboxypeptidase [Aliiroseovarius sp.]